MKKQKRYFSRSATSTSVSGHLSRSPGRAITFCLGLALSLLGVSYSGAAVVVSAGENTLFNETFADNSNAWTDVSVVNGSGTASAGTAAISGGDWQPSIPGDGTQVDSVYTSGTSFDLANGPISLYASVKVDNLSLSRFRFEMGESTGSHYIFAEIIPGSTGKIGYRTTNAEFSNGASTSIGTTSGIITSTAQYYTFKLTVTAPGGSVEPEASSTAEAFYYNGSSYVSLGTATGVDFNTGLFNKFTVWSLNGTPDQVAHFDQFVITQAVPEPGSVALVLLGGVALIAPLVARRRARR